MLSSVSTASAVPSAVHGGVAAGLGGFAGAGACPIPGYSTVLRARLAVVATAAAPMAKDTNDVWGSRAWSPPI